MAVGILKKPPLTGKVIFRGQKCLPDLFLRKLSSGCLGSFLSGSLFQFLIGDVGRPDIPHPFLRKEFLHKERLLLISQAEPDRAALSRRHDVHMDSLAEERYPHRKDRPEILRVSRAEFRFLLRIVCARFHFSISHRNASSVMSYPHDVTAYDV